jgi:hypothetical protein
MSYTSEEKKKALDEQNAVIDDSGLVVIDMEKEQCKNLYWFAVLVSVGLCCVAFCIIVYGV